MKKVGWSELRVGLNSSKSFLGDLATVCVFPEQGMGKDWILKIVFMQKLPFALFTSSCEKAKEVMFYCSLHTSLGDIFGIRRG